MAIVESRVKDGVLTLGTTPVDFSCQVTNARINTSYTDDGDSLETLCGDTIPPGRKLDTRSLAGTFVQDWTAAASITDYLWDHELEVVAFEYTPNVDGPTLTGQLRVEVPGETYGGDVNTRITSDFEFFIQGDVTRTAATLLLAQATATRRGELEDLTVAELQEMATGAGLPTSGTKAELVDRLVELEPVPA